METDPVDLAREPNTALPSPENLKSAALLKPLEEDACFASEAKSSEPPAEENRPPVLTAGDEEAAMVADDEGEEVNAAPLPKTKPAPEAVVGAELVVLVVTVEGFDPTPKTLGALPNTKPEEAPEGVADVDGEAVLGDCWPNSERGCDVPSTDGDAENTDLKAEAVVGNELVPDVAQGVDVETPPNTDFDDGDSPNTDLGCAVPPPPPNNAEEDVQGGEETPPNTDLVGWGALLPPNKDFGDCVGETDPPKTDFVAAVDAVVFPNSDDFPFRAVPKTKPAELEVVDVWELEVELGAKANVKPAEDDVEETGVVTDEASEVAELNAVAVEVTESSSPGIWSRQPLHPGQSGSCL